MARGDVSDEAGRPLRSQLPWSLTLTAWSHHRALSERQGIMKRLLEIREWVWVQGVLEETDDNGHGREGGRDRTPWRGMEEKQIGFGSSRAER